MKRAESAPLRPCPTKPGQASTHRTATFAPTAERLYCPAGEESHDQPSSRRSRWNSRPFGAGTLGECHVCCVAGNVRDRQIRRAMASPAEQGAKIGRAHV